MKASLTLTRADVEAALRAYVEQHGFTFEGEPVFDWRQHPGEPTRAVVYADAVPPRRPSHAGRTPPDFLGLGTA